MWRALNLPVLPALVLLGALTACSDDTSGAARAERGSPGGSSSSGAPVDRCTAVSDEDLSSWTGAPIEVEADGPDGCLSVAESFDQPIRADWAFKESLGDFDRDVESESLGFEESRIELTDGVEAVASSGVVADLRTALVVASFGEEYLVVNVAENAGADGVPAPRLVAIATRIAEAYAG